MDLWQLVCSSEDLKEYWKITVKSVLHNQVARMIFTPWLLNNHKHFQYTYTHQTWYLHTNSKHFDHLSNMQSLTISQSIRAILLIQLI